MSKLTTGPGAVGTKFISCFVDSSLNKVEDYVKVKYYPIMLENSIKLGVAWLYCNVFRKNLPLEDLIVADDLRKKLLLYPTRDIGYNNLIMECCYLWKSYTAHKQLNIDKKAVITTSDDESSKWYSVCKLKGGDLIDIETNIVLHDFLIVEVSTGVFQKFVYIYHDTHYDYLPLWYVLNKYTKLKYYLVIK